MSGSISTAASSRSAMTVSPASFRCSTGCSSSRPDFAAKAVDRLSLQPGDHVLEIGCGTGRNLPFLSAAVGPQGRVYGVDLSPGMLGEGASALRTQSTGTTSS